MDEFVVVGETLVEEDIEAFSLLEDSEGGAESLGEWRHFWREVWGTSGKLRWIVAGTAIAFVLLYAYAWSRPATSATELFSGLIAALAFLAFLAAIVTVELTVPAYRTSLARPRLRLVIGVQGSEGGPREVTEGATVAV